MKMQGAYQLEIIYISAAFRVGAYNLQAVYRRPVTIGSGGRDYSVNRQFSLVFFAMFKG